ncbi:MAG: MerR family transcriptional regulator, partial [Bacilli bacterium]
YEQKGIITPASIDPNTGYRSYDITNMLQLKTIKDLRELNCSIEEIATIIRPDNEESLITLYEKKYREITEQIDKLTRLANHIEAKRKITEQFKHWEENEVQVVYGDEHWVLTKESKEVLSRDSATYSFVTLFHQAANLGLKVTGSMYCSFKVDSPRAYQEALEMVYCLPVEYDESKVDLIQKVEPTLLASIYSSRLRTEEDDFWGNLYAWLENNPAYERIGFPQEQYELDVSQLAINKQIQFQYQLPIRLK